MPCLLPVMFVSFLKKVVPYIIEPLTFLVNMSLEFLDSLKIPFSKKDPLLSLYYSQNSCFLKVFEYVMLDRLPNFCQRECLIPDGTVFYWGGRQSPRNIFFYQMLYVLWKKAYSLWVFSTI